MPTTSKPKLYNPRHPERTLLYQTVAEHYETWLDLVSAGKSGGQGDHHSPKPYVRKAFEKYLECGIFAHGFARARCGDCGHDFLVAFSLVELALPQFTGRFAAALIRMDDRLTNHMSVRAPALLKSPRA